jgi:DNA-binding response OmpR family regulator
MDAVFSDCAPKEKVFRALVEGACDFLEKPMLDSEISRIWQHVLRRNANIDFGPTDDSDEGDSGGSQQHKQGRTNFNSSPGQHALLVKAPHQLSGTEGNCIHPPYDVLHACLISGCWNTKFSTSNVYKHFVC